MADEKGKGKRTDDHGHFRKDSQIDRIQGGRDKVIKEEREWRDKQNQVTDWDRPRPPPKKD